MPIQSVGPSQQLLPGSLQRGRSLGWHPVTYKPFYGASRNFENQLGHAALSSSSLPVNLPEFRLGVQSVMNAILRDGYELKAWPSMKENLMKGLSESMAHGGLGSSVPSSEMRLIGNGLRQWLGETPLIARGVWGGTNLLLKEASHSGLRRSTLEAGAAELAQGLGRIASHSEPIMIRLLNTAVWLTAKLFRIVTFQNMDEIAKKQADNVIQKSRPFWSGPGRVIVVGAAAFGTIELLVQAYNKKLKPYLIKKYGPKMDCSFLQQMGNLWHSVFWDKKAKIK